MAQHLDFLSENFLSENFLSENFLSENFQSSTRRTRILMRFICYLALIVHPMGRILVRRKSLALVASQLAASRHTLLAARQCQLQHSAATLYLQPAGVTESATLASHLAAS